MKNKFVVLIILIGAGCLFSCAQDSRGANWNLHTILPSGHKINDIVFLNDKEGLIFGAYESDSLLRADVYKRVRENDSIIFKTENGGKKWFNVYKDKGKVFPVGFSGNTGYALKVRYFGEKAIPKSFLLKTSNSGSTWSEIAELPVVCYSGMLTSVGQIFLTGEREMPKGQECESFVMITSSDEGKTWKEVSFMNRPNFSAPYSVLSQNGLFAYYCSNRLIIKDLNTGVEKTESEFDSKKILLMSIDQNQNLWLVESDGENLKLHQRNNDGRFSVYASANISKEFSPDYFHVFDNRSFLWGMKISEGSFFPSHYMYRSDDAGKTWKKEEPPSTMKANPVAFWGKDNIWAVGVGGELQIRTKRIETKP